MTTFRQYETVRVVSPRTRGAGAGASGQTEPAVGDVGKVVDIPAASTYTVECNHLDGSLAWLTELQASEIEAIGPLPFEVEGSFQLFGRPVLLARQLFSHTFTVGPGARIAGREIRDLDIPRKLDAEGQQRCDVFGFILEDDQLPNCVPGEVLYLST